MIGSADGVRYLTKAELTSLLDSDSSSLEELRDGDAEYVVESHILFKVIKSKSTPSKFDAIKLRELLSLVNIDVAYDEAWEGARN